MSIMMSNSVTTSAAPAAQGTAVQAAQAAPATAGQQASSAAPAGAAAPATQSAAQPAAPFAQWLGRQADGGADLAQPQPLPLAPAMPMPGFAAMPPAGLATDSVATAAAPADEAKPAVDDGDSTAAGTAVDTTLLAAMAMPLMPLTPMQIAQAVQSAQGGMFAAGAGAGGESKAAAAQPAAAGIKVGSAGQDNSRRADIALPNVATAQPAAAATAAASPRQDDAGVRFAVQAAGAKASANGAVQPDSANPDSNAATQSSAPATVPVLAAAPSTGAPAADSVKLAGPPTAWRQSLQEALGDRLQVQVGKNVEQAVIRLEPPQLGRIDIAIRHSNGTLEVNISATNGEVLRQLQTVSENLRSDLAQRQYLDVAVSVAAAPKSGAATPGDAQQNMQQQQQNRGRQPGREQDEPGRALAEASGAASAFSLGARDA